MPITRRAQPRVVADLALGTEPGPEDSAHQMRAFSMFSRERMSTCQEASATGNG
jgi:hypothetical protein